MNSCLICALRSSATLMVASPVALNLSGGATRLTVRQAEGVRQEGPDGRRILPGQVYADHGHLRAHIRRKPDGILGSGDQSGVQFRRPGQQSFQLLESEPMVVGK